MHWTEYALNILHQFHMDDCAPSHILLLESLTLLKKIYTPCVLLECILYRMLVENLLFLIKN